MNISFDDYNQIIIKSNPSIISPPKIFIKLNNNSFISPLNINENSTYYLVFSSELTCRFSLLNNETICFYYPNSSSFIHIEYHYDEIQHGSLILSETARNKFYIIFILITILVAILCFFSVYIMCTNRNSLRHTSQLDDIINSHLLKQEAAKYSADLPQDAAVGQHILAEHLADKITHSNVEDI
ncbi:unnamed protein product [Adineta steineri]|uniref:Uncharacterized protein n=1 Tax=Adineta steineri TaxID=433720 RepID=A0A819ARK1_9BILA|nr:unnamed protein product [Adineta steineri]CAF3789100.1 unnamed protein product [Adineta steineri]